jgi:hypothetical protein
MTTSAMLSIIMRAASLFPQHYHSRRAISRISVLVHRGYYIVVDEARTVSVICDVSQPYVVMAKAQEFHQVQSEMPDILQEGITQVGI